MNSLDRAKMAMRRQGPCAFCGARFAAHRQIGAEMARVAAGDPIEDVAVDYAHATVAAMVTRWLALSELLAELAQMVLK